jgi:glycerate dehydrogenase
MKKLVVLDGCTLNPGDLSWERAEALASCEIHDRTAVVDVVQRAADAELILTNKTPLSAEMISCLPKLEYIGVLATGFNVVDVAAARERGIPVCNVPAYGTRAVAQFTFALILELANQVDRHSEAARDGRWSDSEDFSMQLAPTIELDGLTLGVVGLGRIGSAVAELGKAFGMRVIATSRRRLETHGVEHVDVETLFRKSDVVSLHCPLAPETDRLVGAERLAAMKPTAFLINTSRGQLVDEPALAAALNERRIAGAAVDVLSSEPPSAANPLLSASNCIVTPHIAWAARAARERLLNTALENLAAFLRGEVRNNVA